MGVYRQRGGPRVAFVPSHRPPQGLPRRVKGANPAQPPVSRTCPLDAAWEGYARSMGWHEDHPLQEGDPGLIAWTLYDR